MIDYQWPSAKIDQTTSFTDVNDLLRNKALYEKIESYFSELLNVDVILMPSGRASISLLLKYYQTNRSHTVFAPKWTSYCVWDMTTRLANPTTDCTDACNTIIAVHKWGEVEKLSRPFLANIIEDSVDSVVVNPLSLFPNNGDFEILSLPKIIGSYTGGLILVKDQMKATKLRDFITENIPLGIHQSRLRVLHSINQDMQYMSWEDREHENTSLDSNGLLNIESCLKNFEVNKKTIRKRLDLISKKLPSVKATYDRLPPVFCVESSGTDIPAEVMIRNKNFSGLIDQPDFRKAGLIPLHFGASDELFTFCMNALCKN